jgi:hypothetical protein
MALHCTECGFVNAEGANYCQRCGALLERSEPAGGAGGDPVTATYRIDEAGELVPLEPDEVTAHGPALVIRAGGGRVGESFAVDRERMSIGRRPDAEVFLDDVTVSRDHAIAARSTAPMSTARGSSLSAWRRATRCRSASTS